VPDPRWDAVKDIFERVHDAAPGERAAALDAACGGDAGLKQEVLSLLHWDSAADGFLEGDPLLAMAADDDADADADADETPGGEAMVGRTIGHYRVTGKIAQGGMGAVYRAVRADEAFEKTVALKVIKRGMDTDQVVARFEQERRALASLDHPNIARLIDGGSTDDGRPYFVMEYVDGTPIDRYCDEQMQSIDERIRLFREVAGAVAHAHRNLIVHRDLKPDNILVGRDGAPKLLDFGIAKLLIDQARASETILNPMTPEYASPEQRRHQPVTTATDVYSLGVTLFRILAGRPPVTRDSVIPGVDVDDDPEPPQASAAAVSGDEATNTAIAQRRRTTPRQLRRRLEGDLDNVVLKALRADPNRRYASVDQFSDDLQRHLDGLPVLARADTLWYRTGKFVRRHRGTVAMAAIAGLLALVGVAGIAWQARVAARERTQAQMQATRAQRVSTLMGELLQSPDPLKSGRDVRVVDVLEEASRRVDRELTSDPPVRAALLVAIGRTFLSIGLIDRAEDHVRRALDLRLREPDVAPEDLAGTYANLGAIIRTRGDLTGAEPPMRRAIDLYREAHGPEHAEIASVMNDLGGLLQERGELDAAERMQRDSLAMRRKLLGDRNRDVADSLNDLGVVLGTRGDFAAAEPLHREALAIARDVEGPRHPDVASTMMTLAFVTEMNGHPDEAEGLYREALDIRREVLGPTHPDTAWTMYSYAAFMRARGDYQKALPLLRELLTLRGRALPDSHRIVGSALYELGRVLQATGDARGAEGALRDCLAVRRAALGPEHWMVRSAESSLGETLDALARPREAESLLVAAFEALDRTLGHGHPTTVDALERVIRHYERAKNPREADRFKARRPATSK